MYIPGIYFYTVDFFTRCTYNVYLNKANVWFDIKDTMLNVYLFTCLSLCIFICLFESVSQYYHDSKTRTLPTVKVSSDGTDSI